MLVEARLVMLQMKSVTLYAGSEPIRELQYYLSPGNTYRPLLIAAPFNHFIFVWTA